MLTLAIDTTADFGSIALVDESGVREELLLHAPEGFSGILFPQIEALLARHSLALDAIELFAGASGPGSFTGVRIGLAAIKGLAETVGRPAIAVSNLETLASFGQGWRAPLIDARRGEVYCALFDPAGHAAVPESVLPFPKLLTLCTSPLAAVHEFQWICTNFDPFRPAVAGTAFEKFTVIAAPRALAAGAAAIAMERFQAGAVSDSAAIEANYVRRSDAELLFQS
jgi:tRNA threonylcarbamoyladenosine biosynthesis protein TsaB